MRARRWYLRSWSAWTKPPKSLCATTTQQLEPPAPDFPRLWYLQEGQELDAVMAGNRHKDGTCAHRKEVPAGLQRAHRQGAGGISSNDGRTDYDTQNDGRDLQTRNLIATNGKRQEDFWFLRIDARTSSVLYLHTDIRTRTTSC